MGDLSSVGSRYIVITWTQKPG